MAKKKAENVLANVGSLFIVTFIWVERVIMVPD